MTLKEKVDLEMKSLRESGHTAQAVDEMQDPQTIMKRASNTVALYREGSDSSTLLLVHAIALLALEYERRDRKERCSGHWDSPQEALYYCNSKEDSLYYLMLIVAHNAGVCELGFASELLQLACNSLKDEEPDVPLKDALPPIPVGYWKWEHRGLGWKPGRKCAYAARKPGRKCAYAARESVQDGWVILSDFSGGIPDGCEHLEYIEAIPYPEMVRLKPGAPYYRDHRTWTWGAESEKDVNRVYNVNTVFKLELEGSNGLRLTAPGFGNKEDYGSGAVRLNVADNNWIEKA